jgi:hypothetical protein
MYKVFCAFKLCCRECKNRFLFTYLKSLIDSGVFKEIVLNFLPVGHTHCDPDQLFSRVSVYFSGSCISFSKLCGAGTYVSFYNDDIHCLLQTLQHIQRSTSTSLPLESRRLARTASWWNTLINSPTFRQQSSAF